MLHNYLFHFLINPRIRMEISANSNANSKLQIRTLRPVRMGVRCNDMTWHRSSIYIYSHSIHNFGKQKWLISKKENLSTNIGELRGETGLEISTGSLFPQVNPRYWKVKQWFNKWSGNQKWIYDLGLFNKTTNCWTIRLWSK